MQYAYVPWPGWRALRTHDLMYARTVDTPWLLFDLAKDPWQMKNLVDDPASQSLVKQMDDRLAAIMRETGDSWDIKADNGDLRNWLPGGGKQRGQAPLGADWPGKAPGMPAHEKPKTGKRKSARAGNHD